MTGMILADGSFDPVHTGHLRYLRHAMTYAQAPLWVTIASDDQIRTKGREPLLPAAVRAGVVKALKGVAGVHIKDAPMATVLEQLRPVCYVKGSDWQGRLPRVQIDACAALQIPIYYTPPETAPRSSAYLRDWLQCMNIQRLAAFEDLVQSQQSAPTPWTPVTDYSFGARKAIEGRHPQLIKDVFQPRRVLDVGCGPGHLVRLLQELKLDADGCDKHGTFGFCDVVQDEVDAWGHDLIICREVLEHLTILELRKAVRNLCRLSSKYVYVTTRFTASTHLLDVDTSDTLDPTHITLLNQDFLRTLFVLEGARRRPDLEAQMDHMNKGRVLCYEV